MFGRILFYTFFLVACAKPNYQDISPDKGNHQESLKQCKLQFTAANLCVDLIWEKLPTENELGSLLLKFYAFGKPDLQLEPPGTPAVVLWMPSMGHGSSPVKMQPLERGLYRGNEVFFIMPGEWEIRIQLKEGSRIVDQVIQKITL